VPNLRAERIEFLDVNAEEFPERSGMSARQNAIARVDDTAEERHHERAASIDERLKISPPRLRARDTARARR
jgi:hypothetical protein